MQSTATSNRPSRPLSCRVTGVPKSSSKRASATGVALLFVAFSALAQQAEPVPPVILSLDGVPMNASTLVHDFTGLPLTSDGWTDLHGMIMSAGYSDARIVYVSANGNDSSAQVYNQSSAVLGGQPLNPTGAIAPFRTLGAAYNQLRNGYPDVMLLRRGDSWGSSSVNVEKAGRSNSQRLIVAAYGPEAVARPIARVVSWAAANHVVLSSLQTNFPGAFGGDMYAGSNILVEDVAWRGPAGAWNEITAPMLHGTPEQYNGGGTMRRNSASWVVFYAGWPASLATPSRFEENTMSRGLFDSGKSNVYFSEHARNIQSIRNLSLLTPRVGFRQRQGGVVRENLTMGRQAGATWGAGYDVGANVTFENNVAMHINGPTVMQALQSARIAGNIYTAFETTPTWQAVFLWGDYQGLLGGWTGDTVFDGNIYYSPGATYGYDGFPAALASDATVTFRNEYMVRTNSTSVLSVLTDGRITYEDNHYFSNAATTSWFSGQTYEQMITATGQAFNPVTWPDPDRDLVSYMQSIGANPSSVDQAIEWFSDGVPGNPSLAGALANRRGAWDERFTTIAVINYVREGFGLPPL